MLCGKFWIYCVDVKAKCTTWQHVWWIYNTRDTCTCKNWFRNFTALGALTRSMIWLSLRLKVTLRIVLASMTGRTLFSYPRIRSSKRRCSSGTATGDATATQTQRETNGVSNSIINFLFNVEDKLYWTDNVFDKIN